MRIKSVILACAVALVVTAFAAGREAWRGKFVRVPGELDGVRPGTLSVMENIAVDAETYVAICALGDMAMERVYVPSARGAASAPSGYKVTEMASDGWEVPTADKHAKLYDLAYSCMTNTSVRTNLVNGVKVFPCCYNLANLENGNESSGWALKGSSPYVSIDSMYLSTQAGNIGFLDEMTARTSADELLDLLKSYGLVASESTTLNERLYAAMALDYAYKGATGDQAFDTNNYLVRGIISGDPLRALDPFAANWWMRNFSRNAVIIPASALGMISNCVWTDTYTLTPGAGQLNTAAKALVMGGGGERTLQTYTTKTSSPTNEVNGLPRVMRDVTYSIDYRAPTVWAEVEKTSGTTQGDWESLGSKRVNAPTDGVLTVFRFRLGVSASFRIVDGGAYNLPIKDTKANTLMSGKMWLDRHAEWPGDVGYPHESSAAWIDGMDISMFGSASHHTVEPSGVEDNQDNIYYANGSSSTDIRQAIRTQAMNYLTISPSEPDNDFDGMKLSVTVPTFRDTYTETFTYRTVFTADDPSWIEQHGVATNFCEQTGADIDENDGIGNDPTHWPTWNGTGFNGTEPTNNPEEGGVTRFRVKCSATIDHGNAGGGGMGYHIVDEDLINMPSVMVLVRWNFMHF